MKLNVVCLCTLTKDSLLAQGDELQLGGPLRVKVALFHLQKKNDWRLQSGSVVNRVFEPQVVEVGL